MAWNAYLVLGFDVYEHFWVEFISWGFRSHLWGAKMALNRIQNLAPKFRENFKFQKLVKIHSDTSYFFNSGLNSTK